MTIVETKTDTPFDTVLTDEDRLSADEVIDQVLCDDNDTRLPSPFFAAVIAMVCLFLLQY